MTLFQYITKHIKRVKYDVKIGLISCTIMRHIAIYSRYDYYRKLKNTVSNSVYFTACDFKCTESWVYAIIKRMETEI